VKRFTDSNIWRKVWFQELPPEYKTAWFYIKDNCDSIGIWDVNIPLANFQIGNDLDWDKFRDCCNENIQVLSEKKWWLVDFCNFQYGKLDENSKSPPIISYVKLLKKYNLYESVADRQVNMGIGKGHNISPSTRTFVIKRDDHTCVYCNKKLSNFDLVLDHVVPRIKGGKDSPDNLVVACKKCNSYKGSLDLVDYIKKHSLDKTVIQRVSERVSVTLKEKEKDKEQEQEQEKDAGKKKKSNSEKEVHPLYEPIKEAFLSKNNDVFSNWAKEGTAIKQLIKKAEARFPEDPGAFIKTVMEKYYKLISNNNDKYWSGHPFIPSSLNSSGIFDRVLKQLEITESTNLDNCDFTKTVPEGMF